MKTVPMPPSPICCKELVRADDRAGPLIMRFVDARCVLSRRVAVENPFSFGVRLEQCRQLLAQVRVVTAGLVRERLPLRGRFATMEKKISRIFSKSVFIA